MNASDMLARLNGKFFNGDIKDGNMNGLGKYTFANGTVYQGKFTEGMFDGEGTLVFPQGGKFVATWKLGKLLKGVYLYEDGLEFKRDQWKYCTDADRRFWSEIRNGIRLGDKPQLTDSEPSAWIPLGCFDVGDGYYSPKENTIFNYDGSFNRVPSTEEAKWATSKGRIGIDRNRPEEKQSPAAAVGGMTRVDEGVEEIIPTHDDPLKHRAVSASASAQQQSQSQSLKAQPQAAAAAVAPQLKAAATATATAAARPVSANKDQKQSSSSLSSSSQPSQAQAAVPAIQSVATTAAASNVSPKFKICPATMGDPHNFAGVGGECLQCGMTQEALKTARLSSPREQLKATGAAAGSSATAATATSAAAKPATATAAAAVTAVSPPPLPSELCPATIGEKHQLSSDGECLRCGFRVGGAADAGDDNENEGDDNDNDNDEGDVDENDDDEARPTSAGAGAGAASAITGSRPTSATAAASASASGRAGSASASGRAVAASDSTASLGVDTCPATTGGLHDFVDGVCANCGAEKAAVAKGAYQESEADDGAAAEAEAEAEDDNEPLGEGDDNADADADADENIDDDRDGGADEPDD